MAQKSEKNNPSRGYEQQHAIQNYKPGNKIFMAKKMYTATKQQLVEAPKKERELCSISRNKSLNMFAFFFLRGLL